MALRTVQKWAHGIQDGNGITEDAARSGRPSTACADEHVEQLRALMENERRWTCTELTEQIDVSKSTGHRILTLHLGMRKVSARWVPHNLSAIQKAIQSVQISRELLQRHQQEDFFLDRIIAIDETYI